MLESFGHPSSTIALRAVQMDHIQEGCIMKLRSLAAFLFAIFATITTLSGTAIAQGAYPEKPIRLVVGYPPAGGADSVAVRARFPVAERARRGRHPARRVADQR